MTDIEITKTVAEWCGLEYDINEDMYGNIIVFIPDEEQKKKDYPDCNVTFDPLHDWNDLMTIVMPRLPGNYRVGQWLGGYTVSQNINGTWTVINEGSIADLPRAICELVAELAKKG